MTVNLSIVISRASADELRIRFEAHSPDGSDIPPTLDFPCTHQALRGAREALIGGIRDAVRASTIRAGNRWSLFSPAAPSHEAVGAGLARLVVFADMARTYLAGENRGQVGRELANFIGRVCEAGVETIELRCIEDDWLPIGLLFVSKRHAAAEVTLMDLMSMASTALSWVHPGHVNPMAQDLPPFPWQVVGIWTPSLGGARGEVDALGARHQFSVSRLAEFRRPGDEYPTVVARAVASGATHQLLHLACHLGDGGGVGIHDDVLHVCDPDDDARTVEIAIVDVNAALEDLHHEDDELGQCALVVANFCTALCASKIRWMLLMLASQGGALVGPFDEIDDTVAARWSEQFYSGLEQHLSVAESLRTANRALIADGTFEALMYGVAGDGRLRASLTPA